MLFTDASFQVGSNLNTEFNYIDNEIVDLRDICTITQTGLASSDPSLPEFQYTFESGVQVPAANRDPTAYGVMLVHTLESATGVGTDLTSQWTNSISGNWNTTTSIQFTDASSTVNTAFGYRPNRFYSGGIIYQADSVTIGGGGPFTYTINNVTPSGPGGGAGITFNPLGYVLMTIDEWNEGTVTTAANTFTVTVDTLLGRRNTTIF